MIGAGPFAHAQTPATRNAVEQAPDNRYSAANPKTILSQQIQAPFASDAEALAFDNSFDPDAAAKSVPLPQPALDDLNQGSVLSADQLQNGDKSILVPSQSTPVQNGSMPIDSVPPVSNPFPSEPTNKAGLGKGTASVELSAGYGAVAANPGSIGMDQEQQETARTDSIADELMKSIRLSILDVEQKRAVELQELISIGLVNAPALAVVRIQASIANEEITRQSAVFDWTTFLDTNWNSASNPIDNSLAGVQDRLDRDDWINRGGLRQRNLYGGAIEVSQGLSTAASNSQFFNPVDQGIAALQLQYRQPLLRNGGRIFGESQLRIALADRGIASEEVSAQVQGFILQVAEGYWNLVALRGELLATVEALEKSQMVLDTIEKRAGIDTNGLQLARAKAAMKLREGAVVSLAFQIAQAQEGLLRLVYGQGYEQYAPAELLPNTMPAPLRPADDIGYATSLAYSQRPEVKIALTQIQRASVQLGVAKNQLLPVMEMVLSGSNQGIRGGYDITRALNDQFTQGPPTYGAGLTFERPIGNRRAKAEFNQANYNLVLLQKQFEETSSQIALEVRTAVLRVDQARRGVLFAAQAYDLSNQELSILEQRAAMLLDGDQVGALYLDNLLQTQDRYARSQTDLVRAYSVYSQSLFEYQRAIGTLLQSVP